MVENKWSGQNPWMGLAPYTEGTTLYGRSEECLVLSEIIKNNVASIVFGKSGIGKSSLLSAGISPLLREEDYVPLRIRLVHNTEATYVDQIKKTIKESIVCDDQLQASVPEFGLWDFFHRHEFYSENGEKCVPVIILDQFEEIYTLTDNEHKNAIIDFFSELSSLLNDIKPDAVIEYEKSMDNSHADEEGKDERKGFVLKRSRGKSIKYLADINFRLVVCLREDKLYLLERNSANIPSFKTNRYNLRALSPQSATEVIMCPRPDLFSNEEAIAIVDKISDMGEEGTRTVDPAILSLFLYKYFEKRGATNYDNIFAEYYMESTSGIRSKSMAFLENHLLTLSGYRNQIPLDDAIKSGVSHSEINELLEKVILRTEKRKDIDYIEFSHDRLCEEAKRCRDERNLLIQKKAARNKMMIGGSIIIVLFLVILLFASKNKELKIIQNELEGKQKELKENIGLINRKNVSLDSLVREKNSINSKLQSEIMLSQMKSDSLIFINKQLSVAIDSMSKLTAEIKTLKSEQNGNQEAVSLQQAQEQSDQRKAITRSMHNALKTKFSVKELMQSFYAIVYAISNSNVFPKKAVNELQWKFGYFSSLRQISEDSFSYNGHMIFDYHFLSDLEKRGNIVYQEADTYARNAVNMRQIPTNIVLVKTCYVKANSIATYSFASRGQQELAVVAEPGGSLGLRVHVTNNKGYDKWFGDDSNKKTGASFKYISFQNPDNIRNTVTMEVKNYSDKDITFAVISN